MKWVLVVVLAFPWSLALLLVYRVPTLHWFYQLPLRYQLAAACMAMSVIFAIYAWVYSKRHP